MCIHDSLTEERALSQFVSVAVVLIASRWYEFLCPNSQSCRNATLGNLVSITVHQYQIMFD